MTSNSRGFSKQLLPFKENFFIVETYFMSELYEISFSIKNKSKFFQKLI